MLGVQTSTAASALGVPPSHIRRDNPSNIWNRNGHVWDPGAIVFAVIDCPVMCMLTRASSSSSVFDERSTSSCDDMLPEKIFSASGCHFFLEIPSAVVLRFLICDPLHREWETES